MFAVVALCLLSLTEETLQLPDPYGAPHACRPRTLVIGLERQAAARLTLPGGEDEARARFQAAGARVSDRCTPLGILCVEVETGEDLLTACHRLGALPEVRYSEPAWLGEGGSIPNDPLFATQWYLGGGSRGNFLDVISAWNQTEGSDQIVVALLDTGILTSHPEFAGRVLAGKDFVNGDDDPTADHPHGVATAGLLAANADNRFQIAGVDHHCKILPVKVLDETNSGSDWALVQGLVYAADHGARVISMSLINFGESSALKDALRYAREKGAVLVSCGGNGGLGDADISWPGASPLCITVGATGTDDHRAPFSGTGLALDVVAPGRELVTVSMEAHPDAFATFTGCSAATPLVAGIAALLLSVDPNLTPEEVEALLEHGADDGVGAPTEDAAGWDVFYGWGRVNARRSLELLGRRFLRGDANSDGGLDISDPLFVITDLFLQPQPVLCEDAMDANDDGTITIADPIALLDFLFMSGTIPPPQPSCGIDLTLDSLGCSGPCTR